MGTDLLDYTVQIQGHNFTNFNVGCGVGYGLHVGRFVEIAPYAMFGMDYMKMNNDIGFEGLTDEQQKKTTAYFVEPGIRAAFQVAYPLAIFVKGGYDLLLDSDDGLSHYSQINLAVDKKYKHTSGIFAELGIKWTF